MAIRNLLFDLGGVVSDIERARCVAAYTELGMTVADQLLGEYVQAGPFLKVEDGSMTVPEFRAALRPYLRPDVTDRQIDDAFCAFIIGIPLHRLRALEQLHKRYRIYMLSNTNPIMWNSVHRDNFTIDGHDRDYYFDGCVTSFEAGCVKPDPRIFRLALSRFGITAEETLFFDDGKGNIDAAASLGFATHWVAPGTEFIDYFTLKSPEAL